MLFGHNGQFKLMMENPNFQSKIDKKMESIVSFGTKSTKKNYNQLYISIERE
jgi:hypothetical protein